MLDLKKRIIDGIIEREGGYVNDPADSGGATNYGVTLATARAFGYMGDMATMPLQVAFDVYSSRYWDAVCADEISDGSNAIAEEIVDTAVNMGVTRAGTFLQRSLTALNDGQRLYPDLIVDGQIGPATLRALHSYLAVRDERILRRALDCLQGSAYVELAENRQKDERFLYGWLSHRIGAL
jgi:lysozyme family protein